MDGIARTSVKERRELFSEAAARRGNLSAEVIEKDFWVCWTLKHVFELGPAPAQLIFKGGTSLSKVYGIIERFSEDIDLSISRMDLGFVGDRDPYQASSGKKKQALVEAIVSRCTEVIAGELVPKLRARFESVIGASTKKNPWGLSIDDGDPQVVNFAYPGGLPRMVGMPAYIQPVVRLELGARSDHWPAEEHEVQPYAARDFPEIFEEPRCSVRSLSAERTFWEKITLVHAESHRPPGAAAERLSRHYYDIAKLFRSPVGERAINDGRLLEAVVAHKRLFFRSGWANYDTARPGAFRLIPPGERQRALEADYRTMRRDMIYGEAPEFDELLAIIAEVEKKLNDPA